MDGGSVSSENQMNGGTSSDSAAAAAASYTYWVREVKKEDAAPLPVPRKLTPHDLSTQSSSSHLGSAWNQVNPIICFG